MSQGLAMDAELCGVLCFIRSVNLFNVFRQRPSGNLDFITYVDPQLFIQIGMTLCCRVRLGCP